jgi:UDP:flavonoid glycosyltransferase YjiC (YdhE family)
MRRILILATAGAGGDMQPLVAAVLGLRQRGHELSFLGDATVANEIEPLGFETVILPPEHDLCPQIVAAVRDSQGLIEAAMHASRNMFLMRRCCNEADCC